MRTLLFAGTSLALALCGSMAAASAAPITFSYTGGFQTYAVPSTGLYDVVAFGAQGGGSGSAEGGLGAEIGGDFSLTQGDVLTIAVGGIGGSGIASSVQGGGSGGGGGGGGTFVVASGMTPLVIAGGGGGGAAAPPMRIYGGPGQTGTAGEDGFGLGGSGAGGTGGNGGGQAGSGGGGGFFSAGVSSYAGGGASFGGGLAGGAAATFSDVTGGGAGGFGGGGGGTGGGRDPGAGGGGGGGYSGGGAGGNSPGVGGGGGSFNGSTLSNADFVLVEGFNAGDGVVEITPLADGLLGSGGGSTSVPEPASLLLLGAGLLGLGLTRRKTT